MRVHYVGAPAHFERLVGELPDGVRVLKRPAPQLDLAMLFVTERRALARGLQTLQPKLQPAGMVWVAWPKRASKVATDVTEDVVREIALPRGLVDVKVCAIDEVWSGLKLVIRTELRAPSKPARQRQSTPDARGRRGRGSRLCADGGASRTGPAGGVSRSATS
jgi:hypothetical protein